MTKDDAQHALDCPEDWLWIRRANGSPTAIGGDRLHERTMAAPRRKTR